MFAERPSLEASSRIGSERLDQLLQLQALEPERYLTSLLELPWVRVEAAAESPLREFGGAFSAVVLEAVQVLLDVVLNQRGPGILGYLDHLSLDLSPHFDAHYARGSRVVTLSMGVMLLINELEATYGWLESVMVGRSRVAIDELLELRPPPKVIEEIRALFHLGAQGQLPVSGKFGWRHPTARSILQFVFAHELSHLVDDAESPRLQAMWRDTVWSDYADALDGLGPRYAHLTRASLPDRVARRWETEFVADGLAYYTLRTRRASSDQLRARDLVLLQIAAELFLSVFVAAYHGDQAAETHPSPMLRSWVLRARQRSEARLDWPQFLATAWGPGFATSELFRRAMGDSWRGWTG